MKNVLSTTVMVSAIALLASCGGGTGGDDDGNVVLYGSCGNTPNYVSEAGGLRRWRQFPLTVAIDISAAPGASNPEIAARYQRAIRSGAAGWTHTNGLGSVRFVEGTSADVVYFFGTSPPDTSGITQSSFSGAYRSASRVTMNISTFAAFLPQPQELEEVVRHVALHEMGHALFIGNGHSSDPNDIMAPGGSYKRVNPTQRDLNTLRETYCRS